MMKRPLVTVLATLIVFAGMMSGADAKKIKFYSMGSDDKIELTASLSKPEGNGPFPGVVLMHGCSGLEKAVRDSLKAHARFLRKHGYASLIVDSFGPRDKSGGMVCRKHTELAKARIYRLFDAFASADLLRKMEFIDPKNIFLVGQSNGGSVAARVARKDVVLNYGFENLFRGAVSYYGFCNEVQPGLVSPLLFFAGGKDDWTPPDVCIVRTNGVMANDDFELVVYPNAHHSFDLDIRRQTYAGHTVAGSASATVDSRKRMVAFFNQLTKEPVQELKIRSKTTLEPRFACWKESVQEKSTLPTSDMVDEIIELLTGNDWPIEEEYWVLGDVMGEETMSDHGSAIVQLLNSYNQQSITEYCEQLAGN